MQEWRRQANPVGCRSGHPPNAECCCQKRTLRSKRYSAARGARGVVGATGDEPPEGARGTALAAPTMGFGSVSIPASGLVTGVPWVGVSAIFLNASSYNP